MSRTFRGVLAAVLAGSLLLVPAAAPADEEVWDQGFGGPQGPGGPDGGPPLPPVPSHVIEGTFRTWIGQPNWIAGRGNVSHDEVIVVDHPFDDRGADLDGSDGRSDNKLEETSLLQGALAANGAAGNYSYPDDPVYANNAADIVETRFAADEDHWYVLVVLNALVDPARTAIEVRLRDPTTDAEPFSFIAHGGGATRDGVDVVADANANTFEIRVPRAVYEPGADPHRAFIAAGLWNPSAGDWLHPAPDSGAAPYFDLAYTQYEPISYWQDVIQSRIIAGTHPVSDAEFAVRLAPPAPCDSCVMPGPALGGCWFQPCVRVFRSGQDLGEGVELQTRYDQQEEGFGYRLYRSRYQPYALYNGADWFQQGPRPLVLLLHFLGGNHMSFPITSIEPYAFWDGLRAWADELGVIVAMPLARGEAGWYEGEAEIDVFEVWRDVARHYAVDPERVYVAGMSMGGFGALRLGHLYPDQFAAAISWAGPPVPYSIWAAPTPVMTPQQSPPACHRDEPGCGYTLFDLIGNARKLPYFVVHGGLDELVPFTSVEQLMDRFDREASPYTYVLYPTRRHETSYPASTAHWIREWLGDLPARERTPGRVSYRVLRALEQPDFGIAYSGAYWVGGLRLAEDASEGLIEADAGHGRSTVSRSGDRYGVDDLGPYRWRHLGTRDRPIAISDLWVEARGLDAATIDTRRLGWNYDAEIWIEGETDHDLQLRLIGEFPPDVEVDTSVEWLWEGGDLVFFLTSGGIHIELNPDADD